MKFWAFLFVRIVMAFLSWGYFVPDETWQSVEISHQLVFGNGHLTWEWKHGLRSYLHPVLFASIFRMLKFAQLDTPYFVVIGPRILQAILSAVGDVSITQMFVKSMFNSGDNLWIFLSLYTSNWFLLYASSRTLVNTLETCLSSIALNLFVSKDTRYVSIIAFCFMIRPTTAIFWMPMVLYDILKRSSLSRFFGKMLPQAIAIPSAVVLFDSYFYGRFTIVPWNFVKFNVINNISEQYGSEPWHWYLTNFMPAWTLIIGIYPMFKGMCKTFYSNDSIAKLILFSVSWNLFVYSMLKHKEHRFLMPLTPMLLLFMTLGLTRFSGAQIRFYCCMNVIVAMYLSLVHQAGPNAVMNYLSSQCHDSRGILILTPCHGTPFYSHLHWNIPMKFLQCPPDLGDDNASKDESELFAKNPLSWLISEVKLDKFDQVVFFDKLEIQLQAHLIKNGLKMCKKFWHTHIPDRNTSPNILIYCRKK